jgi:hypothetical protein
MDAMGELPTRRRVGQWVKEFTPALVVLCLNVLLGLFIPGFSLVKDWEVVYKILWRFFRFALLLTLPLYGFLPAYVSFVRKTRGKLIQVERKQDLNFQPLKHWIFRPLQGIGIGLLFETKLLAVLQVITGVTAKPFLFFRSGQIQLERLLVISGVTVCISLFLSFLWTLDDTGIRYVNRKDQEIKMIGKFVGTLMPILFGFYGVFSLLASYPKGQAAINLFKIIVILYPPFAVFSIVHSHFVKSKEEKLSKKTELGSGGIWEKENGTPSRQGSTF